MNPLVSIIVPVYNVEKYLDKCVQSLLNQTYKNIEIILVDDGSPDNCGDICDEYAKKDDRIKVIHKTNCGLAAARNSGQDSASGAALMFLDGDDYLEPNCCEYAYKALIENDVELVMFNMFTDYPNSQREIRSFDDCESRLFTGNECRKLQARVLDFNGKIAMAFMKLIRLDYLRKYNIRHVDELRQGAEGYVFNIQLFEHLSSAYYLNKPLLHYVYNGQSICHSYNPKNNEYVLRCMDWIDDYVKNKSKNSGLHKGVLDRMLYIICTIAVTGCFNPNNTHSFALKVDEFEDFLRNRLVHEAMKNASRSNLDYQRRVILFLIDRRWYGVINFIGWLRRKQLEHR